MARHGTGRTFLSMIREIFLSAPYFSNISRSFFSSVYALRPKTPRTWRWRAAGIRRWRAAGSASALPPVTAHSTKTQRAFPYVVPRAGAGALKNV